MTTRYETLFLVRTEATDEETSMLEKSLDKVVSEANGKVSTFDKWGKYRLAYPVNKNNNGVYILARYQVPADKAEKILTEFDTFLKIKCHELVLRHVNIKLKPNAPATYLKPDPIEMSRSGSLDSFLKENKIENLLSSVEPGAHHDEDSNHSDND
jgi:small subunit ribosomal protein S6